MITDHMSAKDLGITQEEKDGLEWFVQAARAGAILPEAFGMLHSIRKFTRQDGSCGTACCIGGHLACHMGWPDVREYVWGGRSAPLYNLFYPPRYGSELSSGWFSTPQQAAEVVDHFLQTGAADWPRTMSRP